VAALGLLTTIGAIFIVANHARIDADPTKLLSSKLPYRIAQANFTERFHGIDDTIVAVVESSSPERARELTEELVRRLEVDGRFAQVYAPGYGPYFDQHQFLYLETGELEDLGTRLAFVAPILGRLARDPSLTEILAIAQRALADPSMDQDQVASLCRALAGPMDEAVAGVESTFSWQDLFAPAGVQDSNAMNVIEVRPPLGDDRIEAGRQAMETIHREGRALGLSPRGTDRLRLTGELAMRIEQLELSSRGVLITGPLALLLVIVILSIALRSPGLILATLLTLVAGLSVTAAFAAILGPLNLISISFGVLYIGLGVDFAIHLALHYRAAIRENQSPTVSEAVAAAGRRTGGALCLCAITTAIAFFSFAPTSYRGVAELGIIAGAGMLIALVCTLVFLPALIVLLRPLARIARRSSTPRTVSLPALSRWRVLAPVLLAIAVAVTLLPQARFDADPTNLLPADSEAASTMRALRTAERPLGWTIFALADDAGQAKEMAEELSALDGVRNVHSIFSWIPNEQAAKLAILDELRLFINPSLLTVTPPANPGPPPTTGELESLRDALAIRLSSESGSAGEEDLVLLKRALDNVLAHGEALGEEERVAFLRDLERRLIGDLPEMIDDLKTALKAGPVAVETLPGDIRDRWIAHDGLYRLNIGIGVPAERPEALRDLIARIEAVTPMISGAPVGETKAADAIVSAFAQATTLALAGVTLILFAQLRRPHFVVSVLVPLLAGGLLTAGTMVLIDLPFSFQNIIVLPLLFGIAVDNGIHLVHLKRHHLPTDRDLLGTTTARAILFSNLTTLSSFAALAFSPHPGTRSMGLLLVIGLAFTLFCTLVLLPALMGGGRIRGA